MTTLKEYYAQKSGSWQELAEAQDDEIDRLRGLLSDIRIVMDSHNNIVGNLQGEIERLRKVLLEGIELAEYTSPYTHGTAIRRREWAKRVREALGE